jgi:hypothetical protein
LSQTSFIVISSSTLLWLLRCLRRDMVKTGRGQMPLSLSCWRCSAVGYLCLSKDYSQEGEKKMVFSSQSRHRCDTRDNLEMIGIRSWPRFGDRYLSDCRLIVGRRQFISSAISRRNTPDDGREALTTTEEKDGQDKPQHCT